MRGYYYRLIWVCSLVFGCSGTNDIASGVGGTTSAGSGGYEMSVGGNPSGGSSAGGSSSSAGTTPFGGKIATGGYAQCGPCPAIACQYGSQFTVRAQGAGNNDGVITALTASASSNVGIQCSRNGCQFICRTTSYTLADGHYTFDFASPGYQTASIGVDVVNPKNCGCCGCCPFSTSLNVTLQPTGAAIAGCCTDSLQTDASNCGTCGHVCPSGIDCAAGHCLPSMQGCIYKSSGFTNCNAYCASIGKTCTAGCGIDSTETFAYQTTSCTNPGSTVTGYGSSEPCSTTFTWNNSGTDSFTCCCSNE